MIELTENQQQAVDQHPGEPLELVDPRSQAKYVLVPENVFAQIRALLADGDDLHINPQDLAALVNKIMREDDVNDPWLDEYQKYKESK